MFLQFFSREESYVGAKLLLFNGDSLDFGFTVGPGKFYTTALRIATCAADFVGKILVNLDTFQEHRDKRFSRIPNCNIHYCTSLSACTRGYGASFLKKHNFLATRLR